MTISDFLCTLNSFNGRSKEQQKLYAHMVLMPEATDEELRKAVGINSKTSYKSIKQNLLQKNLKIEPIDY